MPPDEQTPDPETAPDLTPETPPLGGVGDPPVGGTAPDPAGDGRPAAFDRAYVEQLRKSEAGYRVWAKHADTLSARLVTAYAAGCGGPVAGTSADPD